MSVSSSTCLASSHLVVLLPARSLRTSYTRRRNRSFKTTQLLFPSSHSTTRFPSLQVSSKANRIVECSPSANNSLLPAKYPNESSTKMEEKDWTSAYIEKINASSIADNRHKESRKVVPWNLATTLLFMLVFEGCNLFLLPRIWLISDSISYLIFMLGGFGVVAILCIFLICRFRPLVPSDWFRLSPLSVSNCIVDIVIGYILMHYIEAPLTLINYKLVPPHWVSMREDWSSSLRIAVLGRDYASMAIQYMVIALLGPIQEEIVYRGFLIPSLTKYIPLPSSVVLTAVAFALRHTDACRILPLTFGGIVLGCAFARTSSLLPPLVLHTLWNISCCILCTLYYLKHAY